MSKKKCYFEKFPPIILNFGFTGTTLGANQNNFSKISSIHHKIGFQITNKPIKWKEIWIWFFYIQLTDLCDAASSNILVQFRLRLAISSET